MNVNEMTLDQLRALPSRGWDEEIGCFDSLVILPTEEIHDSGYSCMDFVAVRDSEPVCRLSGCSDVLNLDGIGGCGSNWIEKYGTVPSAIPPKGWSIDCLPKSGTLRLFCRSRWLTCGPALSSFEVFAEEIVEDNK